MSFARTEGRRLNSLGLRLTGWYLLAFLVSTALLSAAVGLEVRSSVRDNDLRSVGAALAAHKQALETSGTAGLAQFAQQPTTAEQRLYLRVVGANGVTEFEYRSDRALQFAEERLAPAATAPPYQTVRGSDGARWDLATASLGGGRFLQLALHDPRSDRLLGHLRVGLAVGWLLAVVLGLLGGFVLTRLSLEPVHRLTTTARAVLASGDLGLRVSETGVDGDLRELSQLFNRVLARNQALVQGMREALDNVAHDLRTPLTRLRTGAEMALREETPARDVREALADAVEESDQVLGMLTSLMDITEAETGVMRLSLSPLDLSALTAETIELYAHVAEERGIRVVARLSDPVRVEGDRHRLQQAIANLLDNALKYTAVDGLVEMSTERSAGEAGLAVRDNGMGIPPEDLPRIWTRLFRGDASRSQRGLGLGLSFVKAIIEAHGGQVTAQSEGLGSTFTVRLPALR